MRKYIILTAFIIFLIVLYFTCSKQLCSVTKMDIMSNIIITENTIWTYWEQGIENITPFSKKCLQTWRRKNPYHNIIIVDKNTVYNYLCKNDLPPNWKYMLKVQHKSDFVRLALLEKYGGIWMDLTTICVRPINSVFKQTKSIEGFAIRGFSRNRDLSVFENWFISCKKGSRIIKIWKKEFLKVFGRSIIMHTVDKKYFQNMDTHHLSHGWYLTMHKVLMRCNQFDPEFNDLYTNDSLIFGAEETAFLHYIHYGWESSNVNMLFKEDNQFIDKVEKSNTPILKFNGSWNKPLNKMREEDFNDPNSVIYKLLN